MAEGIVPRVKAPGAAWVSRQRRLDLVSFLSVVLFLFLWEAIPRLHWVDGFFTSQPSKVLAAGFQISRSGSLFQDLSVTLSEFGLGFALALAAGIPSGWMLGIFPTLRALLDPPIMAIYATPDLALLPIVVLWLGVGMESKVAMAFVGAVIPIVVNTTVGVRRVDPNLLTAARSFGARPWNRFSKVILPASLPEVMLGIRLGMSRAVLGVIVSEMYVSQQGLGNKIMQFGSAFRVDDLLFYVLLVSAFGVGGGAILAKLETRLRNPFQ